MIRTMALCCVVALAASVHAAEKPATLSPQEVSAGWLLLYDGESTFGWKMDGESRVNGGVLKLGGSKKTTTATFTTTFGDYDAVIEVEGPGEIKFSNENSTAGTSFSAGSHKIELTVRQDPKISGISSTSRAVSVGSGVVLQNINVEASKPVSLQIVARANQTVKLKSAKLKPVGTRALFNGKDLTGWKVFTGDPKRKATTFGVTSSNELSAKNGPGDLQTEQAFDNFVLQIECKTNGKWLNSGIFFRCIADQYQNGYECQIQNGFKLDDRTKPNDFGTGAIYRRISARKVVSNDQEWFTLTLVANGKHISTWVNGYQTVDWTDERPDNVNPRKGFRAAKGHLSIQGHDPTTDLLFRNIRIAELPMTK